MSTEKKTTEIAAVKNVLNEVGIPAPKQKEILALIVTIENKTKEWAELSAVVSEGPSDKVAAKLAVKNRLLIKKDRIEADKFLKGKREEVQEKMKEYTLEDKAYLKLAQYYEKIAKDHEEVLSEIETAGERYEAEQKKILRDTRLEKLKEVTEDGEMFPVEGMTEIAFQSMYNGLKLTKEKAERDRIELVEREAKEKADQLASEALEIQKKETFQSRRIEMQPYLMLEYEGKGNITIDTTEEEYAIIRIAAQAAQKVKLELEEKAQKERAAAQVEASRIEDLRKKLFILGMKFDGVHFSFQTASVVWDEFSKLPPTESVAKLVMLESHIKVLKLATVPSSPITIPVQSYAVQLTAQKKPASRKGIMLEWIAGFVLPELTYLTADMASTRTEIVTKFEGFTKWAKKEVDKISN